MGRRNNDILWKGILERVFDDFLRFLFADADKVFDLGRGFEFLDKELAQLYPAFEKKSETRFVDKLVKVFQRDGTEEWVLCHVEVQEQHDAKFGERMFKYYYRIFDRFDRPVTAVAIFPGMDRKKLTARYEKNFLGTTLTYQYNTLCILDYTEADLETANNPFAIVALVVKKALLEGKVLDSELLSEKLLLARTLLSKGFNKKKVEGILCFLRSYIRFKDPEFYHRFDHEIEGVTEKSNNMDIREQEIEVRVENAIEDEDERIIKRLLSRTQLSTEEIATLIDVSVEFVNEVKADLQ